MKDDCKLPNRDILTNPQLYRLWHTEPDTVPQSRLSGPNTDAQYKHGSLPFGMYVLPAFLHVGLVHLFINVTMLNGQGSLVQKRFGCKGFCCLFLCGAIWANMWFPYSVGENAMEFSLMGVYVVDSVYRGAEARNSTDLHQKFQQIYVLLLSKMMRRSGRLLPFVAMCMESV